METEPQLNENSLDAQIAQINAACTAQVDDQTTDNTTKKPKAAIFKKYKDFDKSYSSLNKNKAVMTKQELFDVQILPLLLGICYQNYHNDPESKKNWNQLRHLALSADLLGGVLRTYYYHSKNQNYLPAKERFGRIYSHTFSLHSPDVKFGGLQSLPKWIRSALASPFYFDLDINNCHTVLLWNLARIYYPAELTLKNINFFVNNRQKVNHLIITRFQLEKFFPSDTYKQLLDKSKLLITLLLYGGTVNTWQKLLSIPETNNNGRTDHNHPVANMVVSNKSRDDGENGEDDFTENHFSIESFLKEIKSFYTLEWQKCRVPGSDLVKKYLCAKFANDPQGEPINKSKFLAHLLQHTEKHVIGVAEKYLIESEGRFVDTCTFDGLHIRKRYFATAEECDEGDDEECNENPNDTWVDIDITKSFDRRTFTVWETELDKELILRVQHFILKQTQFIIEFSVKPWNEDFRTKITETTNLQPLRRTYCEIKYFLEVTQNLAYVKGRKAYYHDGLFHDETSCKAAIRDNTYHNSIFPPHVEVEDETQPSNVKKSPPKYNKAKNKEEQVQIFWEVYKLDLSRRMIRNILFHPNEKVQPNVYGKLQEHQELLPIFALFTPMNNFSLLSYRRIPDQLDSSPTTFHDYSKNFPAMIPEEFSFKALFNEDLLKFKSPSLREAYHNNYWLVNPFLNHIYLTLNRNNTYFLYLLKFLADMVQKPFYRQSGVIVILSSEIQGTGKSTLVKCFQDLLDPFSLAINDLNQVFGQFATALDHKLLLHVEDAPSTDLEKNAENLKKVVTSDFVKTERKFFDSYYLSNHARIIITTNNTSTLKIDIHTRRHVQFQCSPELKDNHAYFATFEKYWKSTLTRKRCLEFLKTMDLSNFNSEKERPKTEIMISNFDHSIEPLKLFYIGVSLFFHRIGMIQARTLYPGVPYNPSSLQSSWIWMPSAKAAELCSIWLRQRRTNEPLQYSPNPLKQKVFSKVNSKQIGRILTHTGIDEHKPTKMGSSHITFVPFHIKYWQKLGIDIGLWDNDNEIDIQTLQLYNNCTEIFNL